MTLENQIIEEIEEQPEGLNIKTSEEAIYVYKNYSKQKIEQRDEIQRRNACKPEWIIRDDIVVSGMSGRFPGLLVLLDRILIIEFVLQTSTIWYRE